MVVFCNTIFISVAISAIIEIASYIFVVQKLMSFMPFGKAHLPNPTNATPLMQWICRGRRTTKTAVRCRAESLVQTGADSPGSVDRGGRARVAGETREQLPTGPRRARELRMWWLLLGSFVTLVSLSRIRVRDSAYLTSTFGCCCAI